MARDMDQWSRYILIALNGGRPKRTWQDTCREDLQEMDVSGTDTVMKPGAWQWSCSKKTTSAHVGRTQKSNLTCQNLGVLGQRGVKWLPSVPVGTGRPKSKSKFKLRRGHHKKRLSCLKGTLYTIKWYKHTVRYWRVVAQMTRVTKRPAVPLPYVLFVKIIDKASIIEIVFWQRTLSTHKHCVNNGRGQTMSQNAEYIQNL